MTEAPFPSPPPAALGDMPAGEFRKAAHEIADRVADYLEQLERYRVVPELAPGSIRAALPGAAPRTPEPMDAILADYARLIEPNITHWQHPGFMAYFCSVASGPGILGEWLAASLNSNVMLWQNAPASTELEQTVVDWLRQLLGLPAGFDGMLTDTASISSLTALVAARHAALGLDGKEQGLPGRPEIPRLRIYCSAEAHSSIEKAAIVAGLGRAGVRRIPVDASYRLRPELLGNAITEDRAAGWRPLCVVGTIGTTSSTSVDPVGAIADICAREQLWLHVDAAYGGSAALAPELRPLHSGWERADSIVVNPHKWMFTPFDASLLLFRKPEAFRDAFSLVPEYLRTNDAREVRNYHEYGIQLGRRFRALKLWFMLRYFGADGMAARIREHCRLAQLFTGWIDGEPDWQRLAPAPFSTVCFRHRPVALASHEEAPEVAQALDAHNEAIMAEVNRSGRIYLSHTKLAGRYTIRVTLGNLRASEEHVQQCWTLLQKAASTVGAPVC